jgi:hypothetical protein
LKLQASKTDNVHPNEALSESSSEGIAVLKTNIKPAWLEGGQRVYRDSGRETVSGARTGEHPEIGGTSV